MFDVPDDEEPNPRPVELGFAGGGVGIDDEVSSVDWLEIGGSVGDF